MSFSGSQHDNSCHICYRDMDNFTPREGEIVETDSGRTYVDYTKGVGMCPEHGVSYSAVSVKPHERGNCDCGKADCPVCGE